MKLSVITINLNNACGLEKTILSVIGQTYKDYEFLVIDGGSTDSSTEIIEKYKDKIDYWVSEPDKGIYNAMNKAIIKARGDYCYFLNSGDYLLSDKVFESIFDNDTDSSFICGNFFVGDDTNYKTDNSYKNRDWSFSLYDIFSGFIAHQAFFIKREIFDKYGLYDERLRIMADWKLFFTAIGIHRENVEYKNTDIVMYDNNGLSSRIGGEVIYREKVMIAKEELSPQLFNKLERLYYLERKGFITDFIMSGKGIYFIFRCFYKFCSVLGIVKK